MKYFEGLPIYIEEDVSVEWNDGSLRAADRSGDIYYECWGLQVHNVQC